MTRTPRTPRSPAVKSMSDPQWVDAIVAARPHIHMRDLACEELSRIRDNIAQANKEGKALTAVQCKVFAKKADSALEEHNKHYEEIIKLISDSSVHDVKFKEIVKMHEEVMLEIESASEARVTQTTLSHAIIPTPSVASVTVNAPLPRPIPSFSGKYEEWERFKTIFKEIVDKSDENPRIKLYHLEKALSGEAAKVIDEKTIQDGNYDRAWKLLTDRYDNKRRMMDLHISGLFNLKKVNGENYVSLRSLVESVESHVENLKYLGEEFTGLSCAMVIHLIANSLDLETKKLWEASIPRNEVPCYEKTLCFLKERVSVLERCQVNVASGSKGRSLQKGHSFIGVAPMGSNAVTTAESSVIVCELCKGHHVTYKCPDLTQLHGRDRVSFVRSKRLCLICLKSGHWRNRCKSRFRCNICQGSHNTILHCDNNTGNTEEVSREHERVSASQHVNKPDRADGIVLLQTVLLFAELPNKERLLCRAMLDSGSQISCVTETLASKLGISLVTVNVPVRGIGNVESSVKKKCRLTVKSRVSDFSMDITCFVYREITGRMPTVWFDTSKWNLPDKSMLADPYFNSPSSVDILLGMDCLSEIIVSGSMRLEKTLPMMTDTHFGWVIGGRIAELHKEPITYSNLAMNDNIESIVRKFWEIEEVPNERFMSTEDEMCEEHFVKTHYREPGGKYVVQLPLREKVSLLGCSRSVALRRFYSLETRLLRNPTLRDQYRAFMSEYEHLDHCKEVDEDMDGVITRRWYLPHHAVLNPSKITTRCRVVFDASTRVNGVSLNDVMMTGPKVQHDLIFIKLRFRMPRYVVSADISKMFRQIKVNPRDSSLQRIFWRDSPENPLRVLELTTVTYGTSAAPFLATRTLLQLANDERTNFPLASRIIEENFYVDDGLFGANDIKTVHEMKFQIIEIFKTAGMTLHKWSANDERLLEGIPIEDRDVLKQIGDCEANEIIKTLGLMWNPNNDEFVFLTRAPPNERHPTKREVLSAIARVFDPLGLISPVVVLAKLLMQKLWLAKLDWDDKISESLAQEWHHFLDALPIKNQIRIPRHVVSTSAVSYEIHGFADASSKAYGACIYIRSIEKDGDAQLRLVISKSRVAPLSNLTIPRMELLAALLLFRLATKTLAALNNSKFEGINLWSDSQIVLAWLKKPLDRLNLFVRNRVAEINEKPQFIWRYVRTDQNPADVISRGQSASLLALNDMWWNGPMFLRNRLISNDYINDLIDEEIPELNKAVVCNVIKHLEVLPVLVKFGSFRKTQRIIAYIVRFKQNCNRRKGDRVNDPYPTISELRESMHWIVRAIQYQELSDVVSDVKNERPLQRFQNLNLFLDNNLLRVGGRIRKANISYENKHQILLPNRNVITRRLIATIHRENLHIGLSGVIYILRQQFWIVNARSTVRKVLHECMICFRSNPKTLDQRMGDLPSCRVTAAPTFQRVGLDFAGPIMLRSGIRRVSAIKGYICVFVCMVTKAIHLEAVENLSTGAFLSAFRRFVSRRGIPEEVYSDNATNFVGAKNELRELYDMFKDEATTQGIFQYCQEREITWKMIPPNAPHFGGIWEAGVKSVKSVLKKVYKSASLTITEFSTLLCQIEAILNSRPLYAQSNDPRDLECLTPAHFTIDRPLVGVAEPSYLDLPEGRLNKWQRIQQLRQQFWKRWQQEYLSELQTRQKWSKMRDNVKEGALVLVKDDNTPPQFWRLGRISKVYPGEDGLIRVVDVVTQSGELKRPVHKLALLPVLDP